LFQRKNALFFKNFQVRTRPYRDQIQDIVEKLRVSQSLLISAGAGMGVDSGLPDFRGVEGFWNNYPVLQKSGIKFEDMADPQWFIDNPHLAWGFYGQRWTKYKQTKPHAGFSILHKLAMSKSSYFVFTSNVDGHFQKRGFSRDNVLECHGSINHLQCFKNCGQEFWKLPEDHTFSIDSQTLLAKDPLPHCPSCGDIARPNILMFSDFGWDSRRADKQQQKFSQWLESNASQMLCIIEIGAGLAIPTIRNICENIYYNWKEEVTFIRINPHDISSPRGVKKLQMGAKDALEKVGKELKRQTE
jgi:NAD-dependent SIR2 family protein deacetylase